MKKEKIILPIGNNKSLVYEVTPGNDQEQKFAGQCKAVAATQPQSIQDFFIRLSALQKKRQSYKGTANRNRR